MSYREIFIDHPDFLHLQCIGTWSMDNSLQCWRNIATALQKTNHRRVLLDDRNLHIETTINTEFEHAQFVADLLRSHCDRFALLDIEQNNEVNGFFETVCVNSGLNMKIFVNETQAVDWLSA